MGALVVAVQGLGCATRPPRSQSPSPDARVLPHVSLREFPDDHCGPGSLSVVLNALGDPATVDELKAALPRAPGGGVLSVDMLLAARQRGFDATLSSGSEDRVRREVESGLPVILLMKLLNAPGRSRDVYHYVVVDGVDPGKDLLRFQFGDGQARWSTMEPLEDAWKGAGYALLSIRPADPAPGSLEEALALEQAGRLEEAEESYERILAGDPGSVRAWVNLGNVRMTRGDDGRAEEAFERALALAPDDPDALNNLAWLLLQRGSELERAETMARAAVSGAGPHRTLVLDTLARILAARGRCDEADAVFVEALEAPGLNAAQRTSLVRGRRQTRDGCGQNVGGVSEASKS